MLRMTAHALVGVATLLLTCHPALAIPEGPAEGTPEWTQREATNYARTSEAPNEQTSPTFQQLWNARSQSNNQDWLARALADASWVGAPSGNSNVTPLSATWATLATGDPTRYPDSVGPNGAPFYDTEAQVTPVVFYDDGCARISGRVWAPRGWQPGDATLPGIVVENGSIQATEPLYWWFAQALVRTGYVVLTFDPRGQGRSDFQTPSGEQGSNANSIIFYTGMVNAIDFFRSTPTQVYPHNLTCADSYPTVVTAYNPFFDRVDPTRLGIAGHSLGAAGVSAVQGYPGDRFEIPDADGGNPVDVVLAWDSLGLNDDGPPRVPAMGHSSEYGLTPAPFSTAPDPESDKTAYDAYRDAGIPVYQLTIQGSTHYEWSLVPTLPATSWCPDLSSGSCQGGWGRPMAEHYSVAWMDRWLKKPGEPGYGDADERLLADADWCPRYSFYLRSARTFPDRGGKMHVSEDIRADCLAGVVDPPACAGAPLPPSSCHVTTQPGRAGLRIRDKAPDARDQLRWAWLAGDVTQPADFGDPAAGQTRYNLCVYDHSGGNAGLLTAATVPAGGTCAGRPCWRSQSSGFRYMDGTLGQRGVKMIRLRGGTVPGRASVTWLAKGPGLGFASVGPVVPLDQDAKVTVQMTNSNGKCWTADYSAPARVNGGGRFIDKGD